MDKKTGEKITVISLTALFVAITLAYMSFCAWGVFLSGGVPLLVKIFMILGLIVLVLVVKSLIANMIIRSREIEEEEDLSNY